MNLEKRTINIRREQPSGDYFGQSIVFARASIRRRSSHSNASNVGKVATDIHFIPSRGHCACTSLNRIWRKTLDQIIDILIERDVSCRESHRNKPYITNFDLVNESLQTIVISWLKCLAFASIYQFASCCHCSDTVDSWQLGWLKSRHCNRIRKNFPVSTALQTLVRTGCRSQCSWELSKGSMFVSNALPACSVTRLTTVGSRVGISVGNSVGNGLGGRSGSGNVEILQFNLQKANIASA